MQGRLTLAKPERSIIGWKDKMKEKEKYREGIRIREGIDRNSDKEDEKLTKKQSNG